MKANWIKIKTEYITSNISYRKLASKHKVSFSVLEKKARREKWKELRDKTCDKIAEKTRQKTVEKISDKHAYDITVEMESVSLLNELISKSLKHFKEDDYLGGKALSEYSTALKTTNSVKRQLLDILDADKRENLKINKEKLAIEKGKLEDPEDATKPIIVNFNIPRPKKEE